MLIDTPFSIEVPLPNTSLLICFKQISTCCSAINLGKETDLQTNTVVPSKPLNWLGDLQTNYHSLENKTEKEKETEIEDQGGLSHTNFGADSEFLSTVILLLINYSTHGKAEHQFSTAPTGAYNSHIMAYVILRAALLPCYKIWLLREFTVNILSSSWPS